MHTAAMVCTWAGVVIVVLSCIGAMIARDTLPRLHLSAPITSIGAPLIGLGLCLQAGLGLTTASVILATVLVILVGPPLSAAVGRVAGQREGMLPPDEPQ
jgi:multicomponent Na+:H+ antiporter subunit G